MPSSTSPEHNEDPALAPRPVRMLPRSARPQGLYDLSLDELTAKLGAAGFPAFRAKQLWHWVYQQLASNYDEMTNLPADLRAWLNAKICRWRPCRSFSTAPPMTVKRTNCSTKPVMASSSKPC
ncbi:MAG: hypothetical protein R2845_04415 [Thermomicrobiales bacterium]